ncbi:TPA: helicase RepA family protein [Yersinia enterocolitica]
MSLNIMEAFEAKPQPIDYVLPNLAAGTVGAIVSPGGVGKSMLALQLAVQITCSVDLLNFGEYPTGLVAYLPVEDSATIIHHRLYALGKYLTEREQQIVADKLLVETLVGKCPNIFTASWNNLINEISKGRRLIILDTLRRFHQEDENNSGAMSKVIGKLECIAADTGCSIVFLHHSNKGTTTMGVGDIQQASRGSSVLVDNIRWQSYLTGMTALEAKMYGIADGVRSQFVRFGINKANYGERAPDRWFQRHEGGVLKITALSSKNNKKLTKERRSSWSGADNDNW